MNDDDKRRWRVLDPAGEPPGTVQSTLYIADEILIDPTRADDMAEGELRDLAFSQGWDLDEGPLDERDGEPRFTGASETRRFLLRIRPSMDRVAEDPDAWRLVRQLRAARSIRTPDQGPKELPGVSLNHILSTDPFKTYPFKTYPFKTYPFKTYGPSVGMDSYALPGLGGRQPVTFVGPEPAPDPEATKQPVVAIFDTGCGRHDWFDGGVLVPPVLAGGEPIGVDDPATDPEAHPALGRPLEGFLDDAAGHGTFIAGIIRQTCPDARIMPVRVSDGDGFIRENELLAALGRLVEYMDGDRAGDEATIDVLNLSLGYYHETADDPNTFSELVRLIDEIRRRDCVVVCSAGNEATDRETFPAALAQGEPLHVSVGALNPDSRSVALFSNIGDWVRVYAPGVGIVSTFPTTFDGSIQPGNRDPRDGRRRETLDVDDFRGGFGVWSGTSFSAPLVAGRIAALLARGAGVHDAAATVVKECDAADRSRPAAGETLAQMT